MIYGDNKRHKLEYENDFIWINDDYISMYELIVNKFEILSEDEEEIDIQAIEEINFISGCDENDTDIANKVNELIKAVKQLDQNKEDK